MNNYDLILELDETVTDLEMLRDTFTAIDEALRTGENLLPVNALVIPCNVLFELSEKLRQIQEKVENIFNQRSEHNDRNTDTTNRP